MQVKVYLNIDVFVNTVNGIFVYECVHDVNNVLIFFTIFSLHWWLPFISFSKPV